MPTIMLLLQAIHSANHLALPYALWFMLKVTHLAPLHAHHHAHHHAIYWHSTRSPLKALERGRGRTPRLG